MPAVLAHGQLDHDSEHDERPEGEDHEDSPCERHERVQVKAAGE